MGNNATKFEREKSIFSHNLRIYMEEKKVTQKDLMRDLNLPSATISSWVNGKRMPRMDRVQELAEYLGINKSDLLDKVIVGIASSKKDADKKQQMLENLLYKIRSNSKLSVEEIQEIGNFIDFVQSRKPK